MSGKWISLDYAGWEQVDFGEMKWRYTQTGVDLDERDLARLASGKWLITDDYSGWQEYGDCGDAVALEQAFQQYVNEQLEKIVL